MDQRTDDKTVSAEQSMKRLNALQTIGFALLLSLPLIGLLIGCYLALQIVIRVLARSKRVALDLLIAASIIALGFIGMVAGFFVMIYGHVFLGFAGDTALNYFILTVMLGKWLGHVFAAPQPEAEPQPQATK